METNRNELVIRLNKAHLLLALIAALSYAGGFATHAWIGAEAPSAIAQPTAALTVVAQGEPAHAQAPDVPATPERMSVSADDDPSIGPADAPVTIVEFSDYQCPYCKRFRDQTLDQLLSTYEGKIRFVYRDFPLNGIHPAAQQAAEAAECADDQGQFWAMHDLIFQGQNALAKAPGATDLFKVYAAKLKLDMEQFSTCLESGMHASEVQRDLEDGIAYGVNDTPTFFINGQLVSGAVPFATLAELIDQELGSVHAEQH